VFQSSLGPLQLTLPPAVVPSFPTSVEVEPLGWQTLFQFIAGMKPAVSVPLNAVPPCSEAKLTLITNGPVCAAATRQAATSKHAASFNLSRTS
jgi:hypothetical protein